MSNWKVLMKHGALIFILLFSAICNASASVVIPTRTGYVNDYANFFSAVEDKKIEGILSSFSQKTGNEIVVATVESLRGEALENYSLSFANQWGIGGKDSRGVLLFFSKNDKKIRIEVGLGLEKILTNDRCQQIIKDEIVPAFRRGDFDQGVASAVSAIIQILQQA